MQMASKTKIKRFRIIRPELTVEFVRPVLGRLNLIFILPRLIKIVKVDLRVYGIQKNAFVICIPKIKFCGSVGREGVNDAESECVRN